MSQKDLDSHALRGTNIENVRMVSLIAGLKMEGTVKWRGLKSQGPLNKIHV